MKARFPSNRKMQLAFGSAIVILLVVGGFSYRRMVLSSESDRSVRQTQEVAVVIAGSVLALLITAAAGWSVQRDSSRRALAEEAFRDSENRYRILIQGIQDHAIVMLGPRGEILSWNPGAEQMTGCTYEEVAGQNFSRFFPPDEIKGGRPEEILRTAAASGRHEVQGLRVRKDGSPFQVRTIFAALHDPAGTLSGFSVISRDSSESTESEDRRRVVEEALRQSEERYRMLLDGIQDYAIFAMDPRGQIVSWNAGAERIKGYRADEIIGRNFSCFFPPEDVERGRPAEVLRMTDEGGRYEEQGMRVRKDGSRFLAGLTFTALRDPAGNLQGFAEFSHDLSESKESGAKYRGLLEAAPDAIVVVNPRGEIVLLNVQAEKQFGYRRDELVGQKVKNIIPEGFAERRISDGTRTAAEALAQQIGTGIELSGRRKDGTEFPIEIMLSPLESAEGILVTAAIRDISVRKASERHLVQMESRYRGLLEAAPDAMVVVDQGGEIVLLNLQAEKQFGYHRDELVGQKVTSIIPEGFQERLVADGRRSAEDARAQQIGTGLELMGRRKNGSAFPIEIMLSPLVSAEGTLVTAAIRDITATRTKAEARLLQKVEALNRSNEELAQFAYIASHDLQEPLRMVASYTQLLSRRYKGKLDAEADEFIAFAVDGANRMQRLIQDLLTYSRVGTKGRDLRDTSSEAALEEAIMNLRGAIEESGAVVTHDPLPTVLADEGQLIQLFQNLVGNAIKYQSSGAPRIHISSARNGGTKWLFSVQDNGLGIEAQYFERIFGMFQRLHKREEFSGTGIGLAICKKIVERHGGSISVESQPGKGSTFRFSLAAGEKAA